MRAYYHGLESHLCQVCTIPQ